MKKKKKESKLKTNKTKITSFQIVNDNDKIPYNV